MAAARALRDVPGHERRQVLEQAALPALAQLGVRVDHRDSGAVHGGMNVAGEKALRNPPRRGLLRAGRGGVMVPSPRADVAQW